MMLGLFEKIVKHLRNKFLDSLKSGCATQRSAISSLDLIGIVKLKLSWHFAWK